MLPPLKTNEYLLKIDGWKMKCPSKVVPFQGTFVHFRGVMLVQACPSKSHSLETLVEAYQQPG